MNILVEAVEYAAEKHRGQLRKYTGEPYINHPLSVAAIVGLYLPGNEEAQAAAVLHDTIEDCGVTPAEIGTRFGHQVASLVVCNSSFCNSPNLLESPMAENGRRVLASYNRATRKAIDARWYATGSLVAQTIKVCDLIDNTNSIVLHDPKFAQVYLGEKRALLAVLDRALPQTRAFALNQIKIAEAILLGAHGLRVKEIPPYVLAHA